MPQRGKAHKQQQRPSAAKQIKLFFLNHPSSNQTPPTRSEMKVKAAQSYPTLCDPMDYTVHEILQARILEWAAFPFSRGSSQPRNQTKVSCIADGFFTN